MNINIIGTKKRKISCLAFVIRESAYISYYKIIRKKVYTDKIQPNIYVYGVHRNIVLYHTVEGINIWKHKHLYMTNEKKKTSKNFMHSKCTIGTSVKSWFSIHKEVWTKFFLAWKENLRPPTKVIRARQADTPQEG